MYVQRDGLDGGTRVLWGKPSVAYFLTPAAFSPVKGLQTDTGIVRINKIKAIVLQHSQIFSLRIAIIVV
jgi:hypothetical protein